MPLQGAGQRLSRMGQNTSSTPRYRIPRPPEAAIGLRRRTLLIAVVLSVGAHVAAALLVLFLPRMQPADDRPREQGTVELLMVEKKGAEPTASKPGASEPSPVEPSSNEAHAEKAMPTPSVKAETPRLDNHNDEAAAPGLTTPSESGDEPAAAEIPRTPPAPSDPPTNPAAQKAVLTPPPLQEAPVFHLEGTESESNAVALGSGILPAMPDNRFRNRPPLYPAEAQLHGEHGTVVLVIHVAENGAATGVDVVESSGVASLDQAARAAVLKWHFHPGMQDGRSVPFDMPFRIVFEAD
jgi:periplasmic protein TonB